MDTLSLHCARCDAPLDVPSDRSEFYCSYCGTKLQVNRDVGGDAHRLYEAEPAARKMMSKLIDKHPHEFPDGLEEGDEWIEYPTGIISQPIQVRDGRLVNFKPSAYAEPPQVQLIQ
jgi:DNA-directed RNA polymerase subunit RPC12/RpoP